MYAVWAADENGNGKPDYTEESVVTVETYAGNTLVSSDEITMMVGDRYKLDGLETSIVYNGSTYLFDRIDNNDIVVDIDAKNNVIRVYYQLEQSPLEPSTPVDPEVPDNGGNPGNGGDNANNPNLPGNGGATNNPAIDGNQVAAIGGNNTNLGGTPITDNNNQTDTNNQETIEDNDIPQVGDNEDIKDNETPLAKSDDSKSWSILNLLLGLLSILGAVFVFVKKKEKVLMLVSGTGAVISTVAFILTQDVGAKMAMVDSWTILFVIVVLVQIGSYILRNKKID